MTTMLGSEEEILRQEWLPYVTEVLENGVRPHLVTDALVKEGWQRPSAHKFVWGTGRKLEERDRRKKNIDASRFWIIVVLTGVAALMLWNIFPWWGALPLMGVSYVVASWLGMVLMASSYKRLNEDVWGREVTTDRGSYPQEAGLQRPAEKQPEKTQLRQVSTSRSNLVGGEYIEAAFDKASKTLAVGEMENVFRASLTGGAWGARTVLEVNPSLAALWGKGSPTKAANLLEVWASTVGLALLQNESDQMDVCHGVAKGFATVVFNSDGILGYAELKSFRNQLQADEDLRKRGGIPTYSYLLLYLRCLRALGKDASLAKIPVPIPSIRELLDTGVLKKTDSPSFEESLTLQQIHVESAGVGGRTFNSLR